VLADLAALTPPILVCAVFLIAVVAFIRHEMRNVNPGDSQRPDEPPDKANPEPGSRASSFGQVTGQAEDGYTDDTD
jgi:hypothetical protein